MITGDYHHTAIAVARDVGMVHPDAQMIIIDVAKHGQPQSVSQGQNPQGLNPQGAEDMAGSALGQELQEPHTALRRQGWIRMPLRSTPWKLNCPWLKTP